MLYALLATSNPFEAVANPVISLIDSALYPALGLVGAIGAIYCILLGAKLAKAEEPEKCNHRFCTHLRTYRCSEDWYERNDRLDGKPNYCSKLVFIPAFRSLPLRNTDKTAGNGFTPVFRRFCFFECFFNFKCFLI